MIPETIKDPISCCIFLLHDIFKLTSIFHTVLDALVVMTIYRAVVWIRLLYEKKKKNKVVVLKGYNLNSELNARAYEVKYPK